MLTDFRIDIETALHSWRTSYLSSGLALSLELFPSSVIAKIKVLGLYHDIGKCMIPKSILKKSGRLSDEEIKIIRKHPLFSVDILSNYGFRKDDLSIIKAHHEKLDGSGYPDGLKGDEIPIQSQIISVADVYDALTSVRAYRNHLPNNKYGHDEAINIMYDMPGLNKVMVTALNKMIASANGVEINSK